MIDSSSDRSDLRPDDRRPELLGLGDRYGEPSRRRFSFSRRTSLFAVSAAAAASSVPVRPKHPARPPAPGDGVAYNGGFAVGLGLRGRGRAAAPAPGVGGAAAEAPHHARPDARGLIVCMSLIVV